MKNLKKMLQSDFYRKNRLRIFSGVFAAVLVGGVLTVAYSIAHVSYDASSFATATAINADMDALESPLPIPPPELDKAAYDAKLAYMSHSVPLDAVPVVIDPAAPVTTPAKPVAPPLWPVKAVYPNAGALLPFNRIIAYYGNFYSKKMGVLGEYPEKEMLAKLAAEVKTWEAADPATPVIPAIHYIAVTAQKSAGADGKYRLRMPDSHVQQAIDIARKIDGIAFIDIQIAKSTVQEELPHFEEFLKQPDVHLGLDPEFSMKNGEKPGSVIGTMNAADINFAANYLAKLVRENNLPPKILVVHRFTGKMLTGYRDIKPLPEVQIVVNMDGWGFGAKKINTYRAVVTPEPIQFTGFKLFYKNDLLPPSKRLLTPKEVIDLTPSPMYIQYQ